MTRSNSQLYQAVLMEIQRYANIVPNGVQHVSDRDITVNGITIPAFTLIQVSEHNLTQPAHL